jgi:hypothetical protein
MAPRFRPNVGRKGLRANGKGPVDAQTTHIAKTISTYRYRLQYTGTECRSRNDISREIFVSFQYFENEPYDFKILDAV